MNQFKQQIQLAKQAYSRGEYEQAAKMCDLLARRLGHRDDLLNIKAMSLFALGKIEAAEKTILYALKLNPNIAGMHLNAAGIYKALSQNRKVKRHAMEAVRLAPRNAMVLYQAALLCRDCGDYPQALRIIDRCLQLQPGFSHGWHLKGSALMDLGETEAAQPVLEKSVRLEPGNVRALSNLVKLRGDGLSDFETVALLEQIRSGAKSTVDRASATFVLGHMYRKDGQHEVAFAHYLEANALVASSKPFDAGAWEQKQTQTMRASSEAGALESLPGGGGANLVFIVGMPRSGTTLCEQVLSANSNVLGCGELATMEHIESGLTRRGIDPYQVKLPKKELQQAAATYLSALPKDHQDYRLTTDKAPMNFERVGLIHRIFPRARFLYCVRHPLDTILSCFIQDFQAGLTFAANLENITRVYIAHTRLMQHWINLLPGQIHIADYEKYISSQEAETRNLAAFSGLDFEQAMLTPHLQERAIITASNVQARQAVYTSSIGRWKNYRTQLAQVISLLQDEGLLEGSF